MHSADKIVSLFLERKPEPVLSIMSPIGSADANPIAHIRLAVVS